MFQAQKIKKIIEIRNLVHKFTDRDEEGTIIGEKYAVDSVSLDVNRGDFIAVLGHNGSGKSTLAKHINAILLPSRGTLLINGKDTSKEENLWEIRKSAGMVFQNPDNQMVASVVEEDVGFGPENLGVPTPDIWKRVEQALQAVRMSEYRRCSPSRLSGGQKQRVAIAGILAMKPDCIILDEPTSMLDPSGRREVLDTLHELNKEENVTIILITHHMDEVLNADRVFVMNQGKLAISGTPQKVFSQYEKIKEAGMELPAVTELAHLLNRRGVSLSEGIIDRKVFTEELIKCFLKPCKVFDCLETDKKKSMSSAQKEVLFSLRNINYVYSPDSVYKKQALKDISFDIYQGEFLGIVGHTGSGKSTLIQHLNGLNKASSGELLFKGRNIYEESNGFSALRKKVGLVFQYPEYQLFEATVLQDVCFGPKNLGFSKEDAEELAKHALEQVGIGKECYELSPFELSGGQKRRVAIAGVLAMNPEVLILDEPAAALDPRGRDEIFDILKKLHEDSNTTIILVSHSMEDVARYTERMIVLDGGEKKMEDIPVHIFKRHNELEKMGLAAPQIVYIMEDLKRAGLEIRTDILNIKEAVEEICQKLKEVQKC